MKFNLMTLDEDDRDVYITGNFNAWNPKDPNFKMTKIDNAHYFIDIADDKLPDIVEYKFTKGGWENVEIDKYDNITANKKVK